MSNLAQTLVFYGLFPTAPSQPRMAISVELLPFYRSLFERSCDTINSLASALHTQYIRCSGYEVPGCRLARQREMASRPPEKMRSTATAEPAMVQSINELIHDSFKPKVL
ncbi:hypothetical protein BDR07DRAFT_1283561 [Suillus spraguei]|nr:hypothetical protein BDR07DRAFT_1312278 [Suillus spraguei]KAG2362877.1 hypothetical protein BDR07DRAFT_1283561 [Suillus spraguei]